MCFYLVPCFTSLGFTRLFHKAHDVSIMYCAHQKRNSPGLLIRTKQRLTHSGASSKSGFLLWCRELLWQWMISNCILAYLDFPCILLINSPDLSAKQRLQPMGCLLHVNNHGTPRTMCRAHCAQLLYSNPKTSYYRKFEQPRNQQLALWLTNHSLHHFHDYNLFFWVCNTNLYLPAKIR